MSQDRRVKTQFYDDDCFMLDPSTIDGLVHRGFLRSEEQHDMDAVERALKAFLRFEFGGRTNGTTSSLEKLDCYVLKSPPTATVIVSPEGRAALSELIVDKTLVALVKAGLLPPAVAVGVLDEVIGAAVARKLYGGVVEGARFARESLLYELGRAGVV
jgi:hypothetical protein